MGRYKPRVVIHGYSYPHMRYNKEVRLTQGAKQIDNNELHIRDFIPRAFQKFAYSPSS
jgi:hypothetical protein